jgi:type V secretory pathway adhesin AidA
MAELRSHIADYLVVPGASLSLYLSPGTTFRLGGEPILCNAPINLTMDSSHGGATLDAEQASGTFRISDGCHLKLGSLSLVHGHAQGQADDGSGGGIYVRGDSMVTLQGSNITACTAEVVRAARGSSFAKGESY